MSLFQDVKYLVHPYYFLNIFMSCSYILAKSITPLCLKVFHQISDCELTGWETEVCFLMLVVIMFRTRRSGSRSLLSYVTTASMYAKCCNAVLWFSADPIKGVIFVLLVIVHFVVFGEPVYGGPENIVYFQGNTFEEEQKRGKSVHWLITFYAPWSPACSKLAPVFAKLSNDYSCKTLKFGKIDVSRQPEMSKKYHINDTSLSLQLPTIALYTNGKEVMRRPCLDSRGRYVRFYFTEDNIKATFDMNNLYSKSHKNDTETQNDKQHHKKMD